MKKKRWEFKPPPLPTPPILFIFRMPKHYFLFKNIRKYSFFNIAFHGAIYKTGTRAITSYFSPCGRDMEHFIAYCPRSCYCLFMISSVALPTDAGRQVGRFCPRALSHAIAKRSWLTNLITCHDSPLQHGSSPPTLLLLTVLSTVSVDG